MRRRPVLLILMATSAAALQIAEIVPLRAAMLMKTWQAQLTEVDQKVGVVPELGGTSAGVMRFGPELERRKNCAKQFQFFYESAFGLAAADKSEYPAAKRELLTCLHIAGGKRGPDAAVFAALKSPATMSIVERAAAEWSVLALTVNPTERSLATITEAERETLAALRVLATASGASLRVHCDAEATLCGDAATLCLQPLDAYAAGTELAVPAQWFRCEA